MIKHCCHTKKTHSWVSGQIFDPKNEQKKRDEACCHYSRWTPAWILQTRQRTAACGAWWPARRWVWATTQRRWNVTTLQNRRFALNYQAQRRATPWQILTVHHTFPAAHHEQNPTTTWSSSTEIPNSLYPRCDSTIFRLTFSLPPLNSSLIFKRASTVLFRSLCRRRPKSLNMVDPPDSTMFYQTGRRRRDAMTHRPELPESWTLVLE